MVQQGAETKKTDYTKNLWLPAVHRLSQSITKHFDLVNLKKTEYYQSKFHQYKSNIKKTWQCLNCLLEKSQTPKSDLFNINYNKKISK